jgi:hypothetical protein
LEALVSNEQDSDRAIPATDGSLGGPGEGSTLSSSLPAGPPGAVSLPERHPLIELTLKVRVDINMPMPAGLAERLDGDLRYWSDGRKHFSAELVEHGLTALIGQAVYEAVVQKYYALYGNEMIVSEGGRRSTSRASTEAVAETKNSRSHIYGSVRCAKAELAGDEPDE